MAAKEKRQAEYLKRYLSSPEGSEPSRRRKKSPRVTDRGGIRIVDDDISYVTIAAEELRKELEEDGEEDLPVVADFIDERPEAVKVMEEFQKHDKWKPLSYGDGNWKPKRYTPSPVPPGRRQHHDTPEPPGPVGVCEDIKYTKSPLRSQRHDTPDLTPPRQEKTDSPNSLLPKRQRHDSSGISPPRPRSRDNPGLYQPTVSIQYRNVDDSPLKRQRHDTPDLTPPRRQRHDTPDLTPPWRQRHDTPDLTPPRRQRHDTPDLTPPRRQRHDTPDLTPPRRQHHDTPDLTPPRRQRHDTPDQTPPRRQRHDTLDLTPPRRQRHDTPDLTPPRRQRHDTPDLTPPRRQRHDSPDLSPPRRRRLDTPELSPPRWECHLSLDASLVMGKKSHKALEKSQSGRVQGEQSWLRHSVSDKASSSHKRQATPDLSPPRRKKHYSYSDSSLPERQRAGSPSLRKRSRSKDLSPLQRTLPAGRDTRRSRSPCDLSSRGRCDTRGSPKKANTMSRGVKAGLVSADVLQREQQELRRTERSTKHLEEESRHAETVFRDKSGRKRDLVQERLEQMQKDEAQFQRDIQYAKWGKGLAQERQQQQNVADAMKEMKKPLARYIDDEDLDQMLRERERDGDPMAEIIKKRKAKLMKLNKGKVVEKPRYKGPTPPPNRFDIWPGYRWDGVDRSNGFEQRHFTRMANKKAVQDLAYKWSVEDM